jgi:hypothetical protein
VGDQLMHGMVGRCRQWMDARVLGFGPSEPRRLCGPRGLIQDTPTAPISNRPLEMQHWVGFRRRLLLRTLTLTETAARVCVCVGVCVCVQ